MGSAFTQFSQPAGPFQPGSLNCPLAWAQEAAESAFVPQCILCPGFIGLVASGPARAWPVGWAGCTCFLLTGKTSGGFETPMPPPSSVLSPWGCGRQMSPGDGQLVEVC